MTRSELLVVLTCGMSTVASTTLAIYVLFLHDVFLPESGRPETLGEVPPLDDSERRGNLMSALSAGAWDGLRLAAGIATLLIAVLGVYEVLNLGLTKLTALFIGTGGEPIDFNRLLGWIFTPVAWLLGIEAADLTEAGRLLGGRLVLTEIPAYRELATLAATRQVSPRTLMILSYALCGFTHVASMGIFVGGVAALAPGRRDDLAALGPRALLGAIIATLMTGAIAGLFYHGQTGML